MVKKHEKINKLQGAFYENCSSKDVKWNNCVLYGERRKLLLVYGKKAWCLNYSILVLEGAPLSMRLYQIFSNELLKELKVLSTVKIRWTNIPQKAIVPVGRPRPYSIIILNMRFISKASLKASSQITASSYILERHLWVNNSKPLPLLGCWLANKLTVLLRGCGNCLTPSLYWHPVNTKHLYDFMPCSTNVEDVGPTLYKCYTNVLCLLGRRTFSQTLYIYSMLVQCWASVADVGLAL